MKHAMVVLLLAVVALAGCGDRLRGMHALPEGQRVTTAPPPGKVAVVFLRPAATGWTASLFQLKKEDDIFVGLLVDGTKLLHVADPGPTRFMVVGQGSADFIDAEFEAGKTYHVVVTAGTNAGTTFSLWPVTRDRGSDLPRWLDQCRWVENTPRTEAWARAHWPSIQTRKQQFLPKWEARSDRPVLRANDGR
jgi:hypothetical protein